MIDETYFEAFPVLDTERLNLRQLRLDDASQAFELRSNKKVMKYMDSELHTSIEASQGLVKSKIDSLKNHLGLHWAITEKGSDLMIGDFSFWQLDFQHHRAEIGYTLLPEFWGKGYMTEALNAFLKFGFEKFGLHSITANVNTENEKSKQLLLRLGFKKEAYFRESYFFNGVYLDSEIYCLLERDLKKK